ncbi:hypothetical protein D5S17_02240 [Pseudonocardiaceae bacterium YIM PH 21723]|nr:hypothetical protein D5S17_02240 [Pseudonocardiaceae bacterium YIM PH 21723]
MPQINVGGGYTIDLEEGRRFVKVLRNHLDTLTDEYAKHSRQINVAPPGDDVYSRAFAKTSTDMVVEFHNWVVGMQKDLREKIKSVNAQLANYGLAEDDNIMKA